MHAMRMGTVAGNCYVGIRWQKGRWMSRRASVLVGGGSVDRGDGSGVEKMGCGDHVGE